MAVSAQTTVQPQTRRRWGRRKNNWLVAMLVPAIVFLLVMTIYPTVRLLLLSLTDTHMLRPAQAQFVGAQNYLHLMSDGSVIYTFKYTAIFVIVGVGFAFLLGLGMALFLQQFHHTQSILRPLLLVPMMVPSAVIGLTWRLLYDPQIGIINYLLNLVAPVGQIAWLGDPRIAVWAIIIVDIWQWAPFLALIYLAGLEAIPTEYYEAAQMDGASYWQTLFWVTLPVMKPILVVGLIFRVIDSLKTFDLVYTTTKGGPGTVTEVFSFKVFNTMFIGYQVGYAAAMSIIMLIIITFASRFLVNQLRRAQS